MFGLLLENRTAAEAAAKFLNLKERLRAHGFDPATVMPVIPTDNGGEFSDVFFLRTIQMGRKNSLSSSVDPTMSSQKPHVEKNHTLFRDIVPSNT